VIHFKQDVGLCANAAGFSIYWYGNTHTATTNIRREMQGQFIEAGLDDCFPFHEKEEDYYSEKDARLNPIRLAWVKYHIDNPPDNQSTQIIEFYQAWYEWATAL
jgi:hypothetical protein